MRQGVEARDDDVRGNTGIVLSVRDLGEGVLRIVMDDVSNASSTTTGPWTHQVVVSWKDYTEQDLVNCSLNDDELAGLGAYVVARLMALRQHPYE